MESKNSRAQNVRAVPRLVLVLAALGLWSVTAPAAQSSNPLQKTLDAHGSLGRWQAQRQLTYTLNGFPLSEQVARPHRQTLDLRNRRTRIESEGFTVGFNGEIAWSVPGPDAVGLPIRLFNLGSSYFIAMPFVFADPGVIVTDAGEGTFRGKTYRVVQIGYGSGVGHSAEDDYTLFIDPATDRLALMNHSVTEIGVERVTWVFDEWQQVDGLLIPAKMTFYSGWNPDDPGDGAPCTIEEVAFSTRSPDPSLYAPPAGAVIEGAK